MKVRYIGNFPPPYGGVTIKNQLLREILTERLELICPQRHPHLPAALSQALTIAGALAQTQPLVIGVSAAGGKSRLVTRLLYRFNRKTMQKSVYFIMGGSEAARIAANPREIQWYSAYRCIYAETPSMVACLRHAGLTNAALYPNCRKRPDAPIPIQENTGTPLRCVFFSHIHREKGVDRILTAAKALPGVHFTFYGHIDGAYEAEFMRQTAALPNTAYQGIFTGSGVSVYQELSKYDLLLLPTQWKNEGVPGVLVEAKIAGIPAVVSNICCNAEIIKQGVSGVVLAENTPARLIQAIQMLDSHRDQLMRLKEGARSSAEAYYADHYADEIINMLEGRK